MRVLRAEGAYEVARLLRSLADQIERGNATVDGVEVDLSRSLRAIVEFPDTEGTEVTLLDVHLLHPTPGVWNLTELSSAMSHPGD